MPDIFVRNGGNKPWHLTMSPHETGDPVLLPGEQAQIITESEEHHAAVIAWLKRYGVHHQEQAFEGHPPAKVIKPVPPKAMKEP